MFGASRNRLRALVVVAILGLAVAACGRGSSGSDQAGSSTRTIKVVVSSSAVDANIAKMVKGMKDSIAKLDKANGVHISLDVLDAGMNSDKQISQIQNAIVKKPNVLIVDPVDVGPLVSVVQQAKKAGIKTYGMRPSPKDPAGLWDGVADETQLEATMTDNMRAWIKGRLDTDPNLALKVGVIYGAAAQTPQLVRGDVVKKVARDEPGKVQVVASKFADWSLQIAQDSTANFITAHGDMNLVVTANNQMAQGAVNAITSAGKTSSIQVGTYDIDVPTAKAVAAGKIAFATGFELYGYGQGVIAGAVDLALGKSSGTFDVPVVKVTKANAAAVISELHP
jgi:ABC-type sugar transport system substrate-binding protein